MEGKLGGPEMNTELVCVMASLGYSDGDEYYKGVDCLESLKDLTRFLRREDETCSIRKQMGYAQVVQNDLLPILIHHGDDDELVDLVLRLLVNLTSPAEICFERLLKEASEGESKVKVSNNYQSQYMELVGYLQAYKEAFTNSKVMAAVGAQLGKILQLEWEDRSENHLLLFERLLLLVRNVLHVPASPEEEQRTDDDISLHDQLLWNMHINGIDDLIVYVSSSADETRWTMHAVEIISLMLREQNAETLAKTAQERSESEKAQDTKALALAREEEEANKKAAKKKINSSRHSRFGGSYWVTNMKGVDNKNTLVHHKHVKDVKEISFDHKKFQARKPKRARPALETKVERRSTLSIRLFLKEFCVKFLENCYNPLMKVVKENVVSHRSQENDETYYIWAMRFFMMFNRAHTFKAEYVRETLHISSFHYIYKQTSTYYEQFLMHKKSGWEPWQKRLHLGVQAYKELLMYVSCMDRAEDEVLKEGAAVIKNNIFYHEEYREVFILLLKHHNQAKQPRSYLVDLVETFHVFLKLLEGYCSNKGTLLIKKKKRVVKRKKKANTQSEQQDGVELSTEQMCELWENDLAPSLSAMLQGHEELPQDMQSPLDVTSEVPEEEQRDTALWNVQQHLKSNRPGEAVVLLRMCREIWTEENQFGQENISPEEEFGLLRNILVAEYVRPVPAVVLTEMVEEEVDEEEEEEEPQYRNVEREFHLAHFLKTLGSPVIIQPYCYLLSHYKSNNSSTNHAVMKMLHRVAVDLKLPEMLFQLSLLITFRAVLNEASTKKYKEITTFAKYIIRKFIDLAKENPFIFAEVLFWKSAGDCFQINSKDKIEPTNKANQKREQWTLEEEEELTLLFNQFRESPDIIGDMLNNMSDQTKTRRQITNKIVRMRLVGNAKELPKPPKVDKRAWTEDQSEELYRVFEEFRDTDDPLNSIHQTLSSNPEFKKSKQSIVKQLIEAGKISDRSELRKKKKPKKKSFKDMVDDERESEGDENESDVEEREAAKEDSGDESDFERFFSKEKQTADADDKEDSQEDASTAVNDDIGPRASKGQIINKAKEEFVEQVKWVQTRLRRAADARDEDSDWYPMLLLTMSDEDDRAMNSALFQRLLKLMGFMPPVDEQESFWRIPESLTPAILRKNADDLDKEHGDDEHADETSVAPITSHVNENSPQKMKRPKKKRSKFLEMVKDAKGDDESSDDEMQIDIDGAANTSIGSKNTFIGSKNVARRSSGVKRGFMDSDSEEEDAGGDNVSKEKKRKKLLLSDEDEDGETSPEQNKESQEETRRKKRVLSDSESDGDDDVTLADLNKKKVGLSDSANRLNQSLVEDSSDKENMANEY